MHHALITDLGIAILFAAAMTVLMHFLRQPMILGYLVAGVLIGPYMTPQLVTDVHNIETISEIGLILLLFIIGLELHPRSLFENGRLWLITGSLQFPINLALALALLLAVGNWFFVSLGRLELLYFAVFCSLSSTAIVVKSLSDKAELETLSGRLSVGILIFQDLWAIFFLVLQPNLANPQFTLMGLALLKALGLLGAGFLFSKYVLAALFTRISRNPELVVSLAIGWCALVASTAALLGLSLEMGALIAGFAISMFPYHIHIAARVTPLRDFFMTLFFISLGMKLPAPRPEFLGPLVFLLMAVPVSKIVVLLPLVRLAGGSSRTALLTAFNLGQVSEFSLVIAAVAFKSGHLPSPMMPVLVYALGISAVLSTYAIQYNLQLLRLFYRVLGWLPLDRQQDDTAARKHSETISPEVFILGYHRGARALVDYLRDVAPGMLQKICIIDYNIEILRTLQQQGVHGVFGDISSVETLRHCRITSARVIVCTIPDLLLKGTSNLRLVRSCRGIAPEAIIFATADTPEQGRLLENAGANHVLLPYSIAGSLLASEILASLENPAESKTAEGAIS